MKTVAEIRMKKTVLNRPQGGRRNLQRQIQGCSGSVATRMDRSLCTSKNLLVLSRSRLCTICFKTSKSPREQPTLEISFKSIIYVGFVNFQEWCYLSLKGEMRTIFLLLPLKQISVETTKGTNDSRPEGNLETNQSLQSWKQFVNFE